MIHACTHCFCTLGTAVTLTEIQIIRSFFSLSKKSAPFFNSWETKELIIYKWVTILVFTVLQAVYVYVNLYLKILWLFLQVLLIPNVRNLGMTEDSGPGRVKSKNARTFCKNDFCAKTYMCKNVCRIGSPGRVVKEVMTKFRLWNFFSDHLSKCVKASTLADSSFLSLGGCYEEKSKT
jgi:hypothetical protein